jgi:hypothetical protein
MKLGHVRTRRERPLAAGDDDAAAFAHQVASECFQQFPVDGRRERIQFLVAA